MIDKETYKKELVRMWDSIRHCDYEGEKNCHGIACGRCQLNQYCSWCSREDVAYNAFEIIETVEKWSNEHPQKHKISQLEYDILDAQGTNVRFGFYVDIRYLLSKGYFKGAKSDMLINDYLENCEVEDE